VVEDGLVLVELVHCLVQHSPQSQLFLLVHELVLVMVQHLCQQSQLFPFVVDPPYLVTDLLVLVVQHAALLIEHEGDGWWEIGEDGAAALFLALEDARMSDSLLQGGGECEDVEEYRWLKRSLLGDLVDALGHH